MDPRPYHYQYRKPRLQNPTFISNRLYQSIYHLGSYGKMYPNMDKLNNNQSQANLGFKINPQPRYAQQYVGKQARSMSEKQKKYSNGPVVNNSQNSYPNKNNMYIQNYVNGPIQHRQPYPNANINNYQSQRYQSQLQKKRSNSNNYERQLPMSMRYNQPKQNTQIRNGQDYPRDNYNQRVQYPHENINNQKQSSQTRSYSQETSSKNSRQSQEKDPNINNNYMSNYGSRLMRAMPGVDQDFVYERQQKPYNIISCYPKDMYGAHRVYPKFTLQSKLIQTGQYHSGGYQNPEKY